MRIENRKEYIEGVKQKIERGEIALDELIVEYEKINYDLIEKVKEEKEILPYKFPYNQMARLKVLDALSLKDQAVENIRLKIKFGKEIYEKTNINPFYFFVIVTTLHRCQDLDHYGFSLKQSRKFYELGFSFSESTQLEKNLTPFFKKYVLEGYKEKGGEPSQDRINLTCVILVNFFRAQSKSKKPYYELVGKILLAMFPHIQNKQKLLKKIQGVNDSCIAKKLEKEIYGSIARKKYSAYKHRFATAYKELIFILSDPSQ